MPQNNNQVQWDSKPDVSGLTASQSSRIQWDSKPDTSGVQWDSSPDVSQLSSGKPDVSKSLFDPTNKGVNALDYSAAYSAAHPSAPQSQKGFFRSAGEEVWNAVTSPFTSQPSGFIDEPMATATGISNRVREFKNNPVGSLGKLAADVGIGAVISRFTPEFEDAAPEVAPTPRAIPSVIAPNPESVAPRVSNRVASPVSSAPYELTSPPSTSEPAVQNRFNFPKDVAPRPVQAIPAVRMPQGPSVSDSLLLQSEAPSAPNTAMRSPMSNLNDLIDQQLGVQKLQPNVPLREQIQSGSTSTEVPIHRNPMEAANGKAIFDAAKGNPETLQAIHNLTRVDLRQALLASGEDMDQVTVSDSKYAGKGSISREMAFNKLLAKGYSPEQIVKLAKGTK